MCHTQRRIQDYLVGGVSPKLGGVVYLGFQTVLTLFLVNFWSDNGVFRVRLAQFRQKHSKCFVEAKTIESGEN